MTKPIYVKSEPIAEFVARESKRLTSEGWSYEGDPLDHMTMWSPPWDRTRRYRLDAAVSECNRRFLDAWLAAGRPEGPEGDAFYAKWVASFAPV